MDQQQNVLHRSMDQQNMCYIGLWINKTCVAWVYRSKKHVLHRSMDEQNICCIALWINQTCATLVY